MKKDYTPKHTAPELTSQIDKILKRLAEETDAAAASAEITRYLATLAKFHNYSMGNIMLIWSQFPDATRVAGFHTWLTMGRHVRKGEQGIAILAPCPFTKKEKDAHGQEQEKRGIYFKVTYVFDVSQTEGEDLPDAPTWTSSEQDEELYTRLVQFAQAQSITVTVKTFNGSARGFYTPADHAITLQPDAGTKTLVHELAHALLHRNVLARPEQDVMEVEAEAVAFTVCTAAGLTAESSANYIALWNGDAKTLNARLDRIRTAADQILNGIMPKPPTPTSETN